MLSPLSPDEEIEALCSRCRPEMEQEIKFCTTDDGVRIAYATVGQGPPLVKAANWLNHLEFDWRSPIWRHVLQEFARDHFLVRYDERGNGLSDWDVENFTFEAFVQDLATVVDSLGMDRFPILGISQGGPVAIAYAVRHPERVSHLILYGSYARGWAKRGVPEVIERFQALKTLIRLGWGQDNPAFRQLWSTLYAPDATPEQWQWFNDLHRVSTSPDNAIRLEDELGKIDVVDLLSQVKVPTLVLHCRDEVVVPFEEGRLLASLIPGARFVPLEGRNHLLLENEPAWPAFVSEVRRFLGTDASKHERASDRAKGSSPTKFSQNSVLGRYRILSQLGAGGMGEVFLAVDTKLDRKVALKILPANVADDRDRMNRFVQEAKAASALNHPNIITIHEIDQTDSVHFIATEFIDGETLRERIRDSPMKLGDVLDVAAQIASALSAAQAAGIAHRDIKPENIMLRRDGIVKVLDFGLAKLTERLPPASVDAEAATKALVQTEPGMVMGTVIYMSPEQARGVAVDARTDIFSLGVVIYEMVAGRAPFGGATRSDLIVALLERDPPPLARFAHNVPDRLEEIVTKALTKDREERYQSAKDLLIDLKRLRQKLEVDAEIERSVAPLDKFGGPPSGGPVTDAKSSPPEVGTANAHPTTSAEYVITEIKRHKRGVTVVLAGLVLLSLAGIAYFFYFARSGKAIDSIAVLPFVNASSDPNTDYLSDGISETLINSLTQLQQLRVVARSTAFRYKGKEVDPQAVGRDLNVRAVLMGRVRQAGDSLNIQVDLVDATTGAQLWGQEYDRKISDVVAVKQDIAREVTEKLRLRLSGVEQQQLARRDTANPEAYQLYLKGRFYWNKRTEEAIAKAIECFQQAIEKDSKYALAYTGLADCYSSLGFSFDVGSLSPSEAIPKAKVAALKALEMDDTLAEAHTSLAFIKLNYDWDWPGAEREFKRALELNPNYDNAHHWYSHYLMAVGRREESLAESKRALELDQLGLIINVHLGWHYLYAHQYDLSIGQFKKTLEMEPNYGLTHWYLGQAYEQKRMYPEAIAELRKAKDLLRNNVTVEADTGHTYAISGKRAEAEKVIDELKQLSKQRYVSSYHMALIYAGLGEKDQAFYWLESAYKERSDLLVYLKVDPRLDNLRSDPRFADLVKRVGLPQ